MLDSTVIFQVSLLLIFQTIQKKGVEINYHNSIIVNYHAKYDGSSYILIHRRIRRDCKWQYDDRIG